MVLSQVRRLKSDFVVVHHSDQELANYLAAVAAVAPAAAVVAAPEAGRADLVLGKAAFVLVQEQVVAAAVDLALAAGFEDVPRLALEVEPGFALAQQD